MQVLDRVLDGHDVRRAGLVRDVEQAGERRRLARAGRSGHQDEPARQVREALDVRGQAELGQAADVVRDGSQHRADRAALHEDVHAEAADVRDA